MLNPNADQSQQGQGEEWENTEWTALEDPVGKYALGRGSVRFSLAWSERLKPGDLGLRRGREVVTPGIRSVAAAAAVRSALCGSRTEKQLAVCRRHAGFPRRSPLPCLQGKRRPTGLRALWAPGGLNCQCITTLAIDCLLLKLLTTVQ
ncbi:unnamed protein product [Gadus morhua 'NCC']